MRDFPMTRLRRLRSDDWCRRLVRECELTPSDLIWPIFVVEGINHRESVEELPGVDRLSIDLAVTAAKEAASAGIPVVNIIPVIKQDKKDDRGSEAGNGDNLVCRAVRAIREAKVDVGIMCDVALDLFTSHGHDGILDSTGNVDNDATVEALAEQVIVQARAGADMMAPSDMMDGRVKGIRSRLESEGMHDVKIIVHSAKYASALYGPYRDAVGSSANLGKNGKQTYQQDPGNYQEALHEVEMDIREGADMIMVKPGTFYLDVIRKIKDKFQMPTFAFHVSGEYAMVKAAGERGWIDADRVMVEALLSLKRSGCSGIVTYAALDVAKMLGQNNRVIR
ncbi:porphobilinogen synthase [Rubripirellula reticaptiva]|uniref:Delta-aminolevulinic acid dehydratase n=1 Tax=Rubripirellula reticaptiva TaxID=2528013 RepID=A0A5C6F924_9BACT|nr:porphobilinogen synthase [Rubripirellula reticaptiva]TWU56001.1 Delta-aminolevulinic acid dehydratase [Rubripirellula reticaptiva]